jgi:hypothetical protein
VRAPTVVDHHGVNNTSQQSHSHLALLRLEDEPVLEDFLPDHGEWEFQLERLGKRGYPMGDDVSFPLP